MLNQVILMGRIATDPTLRHTQTSNTAVSNFRIAIESQGRDDTTYFFDIIAWGNRAEFIYDYFGKGDMIALCGHLVTQKKKNGDGFEWSQPAVQVDEVSFTGAPSRRDTFTE